MSRIEELKRATALSIESGASADRDAHMRDMDPTQAMLVRPYGRHADQRWVLSSWRRNGCKAKAMKGIREEIYQDGWGGVLEHIVPRSTLLIACHPEEPDVCFGWICGEMVEGGPDPRRRLMLHYCYVKHDFKSKRKSGERGRAGGFGVGRMLLRALLQGEGETPVVATSLTSSGGGWLARLQEEGTIPEWEYDPFLLYSTLPRGWY